MKNHFGIWIVAVFLLINVGILRGASSAAGQTTLPQPTPYAVVAEDANSSVWERTVYELDPTGNPVPKIHHYTELATGLHYQQNGQWLDSQEQINILPNGTAAATQGQHQAYFPGDIYNGQIELVTPDGKQLYSRPLCLTYFDGTNSVVIAELTNSTGVVVGNNQVVYPNAFTGLTADLRYTYTKAGFEQDIILLQQPPTPESLGLYAGTARIEILTEFFNPPQPTIQSSVLPAQAGLTLTDDSLGFGAMQMIQGRAFLLGQNAQDTGVLVNKEWLQMEGRQLLVEEVPVDAIVQGLAALPLTAKANGSGKTQYAVSRHLVLPPQRFVKNNSSKPMMMSKAGMLKQGFVLDYQTINSSMTNYTFQGDTTYYISSTVNLFGTNIFEGGAVIKYTTNACLDFNSYPLAQINCLASAYRPVIFTAKDDDSVGEILSVSTGSPAGYYANPALNFLYGSGYNEIISNFRISYAQLGITFASAAANVNNVQFVNCAQGISTGSVGLRLQNALFSNVQTNLVIAGGSLDGENITFANSSYLAMSLYPTSGTHSLTNCILVNVTSLSGSYSYNLNGDHNGFYNTPTFGTSQVTNTFYPFQTVGGGSFYLTNGCNFFNAGTTNIDPTLLASLKQRTTYPPVVYSNVTLTNLMTFSPQAQRDIDTPDLGYHYDPLDYVFGGCTANSNITFTAGTAVGWFRTSSGYYHAGQGIHLGDTVTAFFNGTPTAPDYWVRLNTVQEQDNTGGYGTGGMTGWTYPILSNAPIAQLNFTLCSVMAADANHFRDDNGYLILNADNSEFSSGGVGGYIMLANLTNSLLDRCYFAIQGDNNGARSVAMENITVHGTYLYISHWSGANWPVWIENCAFDGTSLTSVDTNSLTCDYNSFLLGSNRLPVLGAHDVIVTNSYNWQDSWFGDYYQPTNSPLIDKGNTNANYIGLYHFTTQTNQTVEANSIVDVGYHYVATDTNGVPLDTNGDGIPDYIEDANGNGLVDSGEIGWNITGDLGLQVIITRPRNGSILP